jgi:hypothetical protein
MGTFFSDWLVNRRHCSEQWQKTAAQIREKINIAIQDMPPVDEITQLLQGSCKYQHSYQVQMHDFMLEAGLSIRDGTRYFYLPKMVFGTSYSIAGGIIIQRLITYSQELTGCCIGSDGYF